MVYPTPGPPRERVIRRTMTEPDSIPAREPEPVAKIAEDEVTDAELARQLQLAFAPIHKGAFGMAVGLAAALLVAAVTLFEVVLDPDSGSALRLLGEYFYGYTVSVGGVFIGAFWGFVVGFVGGWFIAFCRNLAIAVSVFVTRTRAELAETREFLDHI